jgi:heme-degrading monooxygenase HmoA
VDDGMYVSVSRLQVDIHQVDRLIAAFRARAGLVDAFPGFLGLEVWRSERSPGEVLMVSRWRARADFTAYMKSEAHRSSHARIPDDLQAAIKLERLDHHAGYDVMAR